MSDFVVKAKASQYRFWMFMTPRGGLNRLRIHAALFRDSATAQKTIDLNREKHPDWQWKVVEL